MGVPKVDWNRIFEFAWRILVFIVAIGIIIVVSTNWTRWEGGAGWQRTNDAYLQADLTPISAKVTGYVRELPTQDYEHVRKGQVLAQLVDADYRAAVAQAEAGVATAVAQAQALTAQRELQLAPLGQEAGHQGAGPKCAHGYRRADGPGTDCRRGRVGVEAQLDQVCDRGTRRQPDGRSGDQTPYEQSGQGLPCCEQPCRRHHRGDGAEHHAPGARCAPRWNWSPAR